jgi:hypothetical protein
MAKSKAGDLGASFDADLVQRDVERAAGGTAPDDAAVNVATSTARAP